MNLSIPIFLAFVVLSLSLFLLKPTWVFFLYPVTLCVLPTFRGMVGMPIYLFDVLSVLILFIINRTTRSAGWPKSIFPWPGMLVFLLAIFGIFVPILRYGLLPEIFWIAAHAFLAFVFLRNGAALTTHAELKPHNDALVLGFLAALAALAVISVLERGSPAMSGLFNAIYFRDFSNSFSGATIGSDNSRDAGAIQISQRAAAGFGSPNNLGELAVLAAAWVWFVKGGKTGIFAWLFSACIIFATVSRQALFAIALCLFGFGMLRGGRTTIQTFGFLVLLPIMLPIVMELPQFDSWTERLGRLSAGTDEANVSARLVDGPERLFSLIDRRSDVLLFGVGMNVQKLAAKGIDVDGLDTGFASNAFLLALYYFGIIGFVVYIAYWLSCVWYSLQLPRKWMAKALPLSITAIFLFFVDNAGLVAEASITCFGLVAGSIFGMQSIVQKERAELRQKIAIQ